MAFNLTFVILWSFCNDFKRWIPSTIAGWKKLLL